MKFLVSFLMSMWLIGCTTPGQKLGLVELNDESYGEGVRGMTGFVMFKADWCPACIMYQPVWEEVVKHCGDKISFRQVDVDQSKETSKRIEELPTILLYVNGSPIMPIPMIPPEVFKKVCDEVVSKKKSLDATGFPE